MSTQDRPQRAVFFTFGISCKVVQLITKNRTRILIFDMFDFDPPISIHQKSGINSKHCWGPIPGVPLHTWYVGATASSSGACRETSWEGTKQVNPAMIRQIVQFQNLFVTISSLHRSTMSQARLLTAWYCTNTHIHTHPKKTPRFPNLLDHRHQFLQSLPTALRRMLTW